MNNSIRYPYFRIEKEHSISFDDLFNLRKFYLPLVGANAVVLYEYLRDLSLEITKFVSPFDFSTLSLYLNIEVEKLNKARMLLESLGLLSTFQDDADARTVFILEKPLSRETFKKNPLLTEQLLKKVGKNNYDSILGNIYIRKDKKMLYQDISTNFFEMFTAETPTQEYNITKLLIDAGKRLKTIEEKKQLAKAASIQNTLSISNLKYSNDYEAALKLHPKDFFVHLVGNEPSDECLEKLALWEYLVKDYKIVNVAFLLTFYIHNRPQISHCGKLINELVEADVNGFVDSEAYLDGKFENSKFTDIFKKKYLLKASYLENIKGG